MYMHAYTLYSAVRPYGCSVILAGYEQNEPEMYLIDPSGVSYVSINLFKFFFCIYIFIYFYIEILLSLQI